MCDILLWWPSLIRFTCFGMKIPCQPYGLILNDELPTVNLIQLPYTANTFYQKQSTDSEFNLLHLSWRQSSNFNQTLKCDLHATSFPYVVLWWSALLSVSDSLLHLPPFKMIVIQDYYLCLSFFYSYFDFVILFQQVEFVFFKLLWTSLFFMYRHSWLHNATASKSTIFRFELH